MRVEAIFVLGLSLSNVQNAFASPIEGRDHAGIALNGGVVGDLADGGHAELVVERSRAKLFLTTPEGDAMPCARTKGSLTLLRGTSEGGTLNLLWAGGNQLTTSLPGAHHDVTKITVEINKDGRKTAPPLQHQ